MSTTVDQRVVEMRFDNKQFENNVSTTMSTLEKFKQKLNLDGATKGLESVNTAAQKVNFSQLEYAATRAGFQLEDVWLKVASVFEYQIARRIISAGKNIVSSLTIDPIKTGLSEYETQINAVQTILANTESKGTTLEDVNGALDTLNTYADKTIYNFTEMTRNIGTFTAAGVDLDTSVNAIQGIANLAAVSGSTSQQASTAMYQLSQALSSGTVKLMDWNSVVNAGMGGQVFQDALKETARVHGINIDAMIEKHGSFRETLSTGWLSSDILTETLSKFTMATEGLTEAEIEANRQKLKSMGYTDEQIEGIFKLGNTATNAATKVKTATQLMDTLKETAQSGWTQTWEIIFGDFEEAKTLFSELYGILAPVLEASAKARNELLTGWKDAGGRDDLIASMKNIFEAIGSIVKPIKEAFEEIFPPATADKLVAITKAIKDFTAKLILSDATSDKFKRTFKGLFAVLDIVKQVFGAIVKAIVPLFGGIDDLGGGILGVTAKFGDWLVKLNESIKASGFFTTAVEKIHAVFKKIGNFLQPIVEGFKSFSNEVTKSVTSVADNAEKRLGPLATLGNVIKGIFVGIGNIIKKIFPYVAAAATGIGNVVSDLLGRLADSIQNANYDSFFDLTSGGIMTAIGVYIAKFFKSGSGIFDGAAGFVENLNGILEGAGDALGAFTDSLKADTLKKIATAIAILAASLLVLSLIDSEKLTLSLVAVTTLFGELMASMSIFGKMGDMKGIAKTAGSLVALSSAVLILSVALKIMSTMSWSEMGVGLISMTVGIGALVAAVNLLPDKKVNGAAKAIKKLSSAILILAIGIKIMSTMSWTEMGIGLISMVVGLAALVGAVNLLPKDTALRAAGMIGLATAMVVLAAALKIMATMSWDDIARSLVALAGSLVILAAAMALMKTALPGAAAMMIVAPALVVLAGALRIMSGMSWIEIASGLVALGGSLLIIAAGMALMKTALPGAAALLVVTAALAVLTPILKILGSMSFEEIGRGLLMLAGVFAVFGLAALILQPLIPALLGLSGALLIFGAACVAIGAGVVLIGVGLTILATALAASGGAITVFVASIISLIPFLIEQVGLGIIKLCEVIAGGAASICKAITVIVVAVVDALVASVPHLVEGALVLIVSLLESLVNHLPTIVTHLVNLLVSLLKLLAQYMPVIIPAVVELLVSIFDSLATSIPALIDPLINLFGAVFQGLADAIGPIIENVVAPILEIFSEIIIGLVEVLAPYLPNIESMVIALCNTFAFLSEQVVKLVEVLAPFIRDIVNALCSFFAIVLEYISPIIQSIIGLVRQLGDTITQILYGISGVITTIAGLINTALQGLSNVFSTIFNGIATVVQTVGDSIKTVLEGIAEVIESIGTAISDSLNGLAGVFDSVFNGIADVVNSVGDSIKKVLDGISGVIDSIGTAALNAGKGFEKLASGVKIITGLNLADMAASLAAVATGVGDIAANSDGIYTIGSGMVRICSSLESIPVNTSAASDSIATLSTNLSGFMSVLDNMVNKFKQTFDIMKQLGVDLMIEVIGGILSTGTEFENAADYVLTKFTSAIDSQQVKVRAVCLELVTACSNAISDNSGLFKSAGKDLGSGLVKGINAKQTDVYNAAYALGQKAVQGEKDGQKSKSPSKLTIQAGKWLGEGLIIGMDKMGDKVYNAGSTLGSTATKTISSAISRVSDMINADIDANPTITPILDLSDVKTGVGAIGDMLNMDSAIGVHSNISAISSTIGSKGQNGMTAEVVAAIDKLRKDLSKTGGDTYQVNGITYDDGSNITDAIRTITRAAIRERRV